MYTTSLALTWPSRCRLFTAQFSGDATFEDNNNSNVSAVYGALIDSRCTIEKNLDFPATTFSIAVAHHHDGPQWIQV